MRSSVTNAFFDGRGRRLPAEHCHAFLGQILMAQELCEGGVSTETPYSADAFDYIQLPRYPSNAS